MLWLDNPKLLFDLQKLKYYVPLPGMSWQTQANAMVRFIIYLSLILYMTNGNNPIILIIPPILIMSIQYYLHKDSKLQSTIENIFPARETFLKQINPQQITPQNQNIPKNSFNMEEEVTKLLECKKPTKDNPFGNSLPYDSIENQVNQTCPEDFAGDKKFYSGLFNDVNDIFDRNNSQRQFATNPANTKTNNREAAIQFFYNTPYTTDSVAKDI